MPLGNYQIFFSFPAGHVYSSAKLCLLLKCSTFLEYVWWGLLLNCGWQLYISLLVYKGR